MKTFAIRNLIPTSHRGRISVMAVMASLNLSAQTPFAPTSGASGVQFGYTLAADANRFLASSAPTSSALGKTYLFEKGTGGISQVSVFSQTDGLTDDLFGKFVSVSGDKIAIGAPHHNATGAVYTYRRLNGSWNFLQKIILPDAISDDQFGTVKIWQNYLFVGAPGADDGGKIFVYQFTGSQWQPMAELSIPNGQMFGSQLDCQNGRLISSTLADGTHHFHSFILNADSWTWEASSAGFGSTSTPITNFAFDGNSVYFIQRQLPGTHIIKRANPSDSFLAEDLLSFSSFDQIYDRLTVSGNKMFIASGGYNATLERKFPLLMYVNDGPGWNYHSTLYGLGQESADDYFGWAMAQSGENLIVGAPFENNQSGKAYFVDMISLKVDKIGEQVSIYPNPTRDFVNITSPESITSVEIYSLTGALVLQGNSETLDVQALPSGLYLMRINLNQRTFTTRLVKQ